MRHRTKVLLTLGACALVVAPAPSAPAQTGAMQQSPPETYLALDTLEIIQPNHVSPQVVRIRAHYSLPESTTTYPGIVIAWQGSDSTDHPAEQPPLDFNWALFGPFADQGSAVTDSAFMVRTNDDPGTVALEWTTETARTYHGLRSGWYLFWVRARDDAQDIDPTPAAARFLVVEPMFERPFMLLDATNWLNGRLLNAGSLRFREPRLDNLTPDTIRAMYESLFAGHGYAFDPLNDSWYRQMHNPIDAFSALPPREVLARYKALVVYDEDMGIPLDKDNQKGEFASALGEYMDVGGRVILIGRNLFASDVAGWDFTADAQHASMLPGSFASDYFGVTSMYFPMHLGLALDYELDSADFASATPVEPGFPEVVVDTLRTLYLSQVPLPGLVDRNGDGDNNWLWIPDVNTVTLAPGGSTTVLYEYNSAYGGSSPSQGGICGAGYAYYDPLLDTTTFRSAIVTFPLFPLKQEMQLAEWAGNLLDFVLLDDVVAGVVDDQGSIRPDRTTLLPNYPNPFNAGTTIRYVLDAPGTVTLAVFNVLGGHVATLVRGALPAGAHSANWNGTDGRGSRLGSGVYFYRLELNGRTETRKMLLLK